MAQPNGVSLLVAALAGSLCVIAACTVTEREPPAVPQATEPQEGPPLRPPRVLQLREEPRVLPPEPLRYGDDVKRAAERYAAWASNFDARQMGPSHDHTARGLHQLAGALRALAKAEPPAEPRVQSAVDGIDVLADRLVQPRTKGLEHTDVVRSAFLLAADVMDALRKERSEESELLADQVHEIRTAAGSLDLKKQLLAQRGLVRDFFRRSAAPVATLAKIRPAVEYERQEDVADKAAP
jgi:hypothetical protein